MSSNPLRLSNGRIADYSQCRIVAGELVLEEMGAEIGGSWVGYQGPLSLLLALSHLGNIAALCNFDGYLSDDYLATLLEALRYFHEEFKDELDPF